MKRRQEQEKKSKKYEEALILLLLLKFELLEEWLRYITRNTLNMNRLMSNAEIAYTERMYGSRWNTPEIAWENIVSIVGIEISKETTLGIRRALESIGGGEINWTGTPFPERVVKNSLELEEQLRHIDLRNVEDMIRDLRKRGRFTQHQAVRLLRTEMAAADSAMRKAEALEREETHYRLDATLDHRTSDICENLDGTVLPWEGSIIGVTLPPFHPHCRTVAKSLRNDI